MEHDLKNLRENSKNAISKEEVVDMHILYQKEVEASLKERPTINYLKQLVTV